MLSITKSHTYIFSFERENELITFSDRLTLVMDSLKFVSVETVLNHKISLTVEGHWWEKVIDKPYKKRVLGVRVVDDFFSSMTYCCQWDFVIEDCLERQKL